MQLSEFSDQLTQWDTQFNRVEKVPEKLGPTRSVNVVAVCGGFVVDP